MKRPYVTYEERKHYKIGTSIGNMAFLKFRIEQLKKEIRKIFFIQKNFRIFVLLSN